MNRAIVFKALVGSHNYKLNTPESDKDYKVFTMPTFEDLYYGRRLSNSFVGKEVDYDYHDVRQMNDLFWKANLNFVEVLFTKELVVTGDYPEIHELYDMRDDIGRMNTPYLFNSCRGMYLNKMKYLTKGTEGTQHLVDKFGYDTKQALHAYRILDFAIMFANNHFIDFGGAMTYDKYWRNKMLEIKNGEFALDEFQLIANEKFNQFLKYEEKYQSLEPDEGTKNRVEKLIMSLVKRELG